MSSTKTNEPIVIETGSSEPIWSIIFMPDGKELLSLSDGNGVVARRWRVADGQEVATQSQIPMLDVFSRDGKWAVHRTWKGASVWDMETGQKTVEVVARVRSVDIASDSARFATGTGATDSKVDIWNIITGERLVGPLQHDPEGIHEIKFSPNGEHIATASSTRYKASVHVFDSHSGDQLLKFDDLAFPDTLGTPLAWSSNGQQIFVVSRKDKIKSIDVSTGAQLAEWQVHDPDPYDALHIRYGGNVYSLDLASNGKFLVTFPSRSTSVSFWDTSTLTQIGPTIKDSQKIQSLALSPDCTYLATGGLDGNITIRDLTTILPHSYHGRFHEPTQEDLLKPQNATLFLEPLMGNPLIIYIENDVDGRDDLVKLITKHGGAVSPSHIDTPYILVDPQKESGQNLFHQYAGKLGKIVLHSRWVHECVRAGVLQTFQNNWAGCKVTGTEKEQPTTSSRPASEAHSNDNDDDLLEVELPPGSSTPAPQFNYDEPPSPASSAGPREVEVMPPCSPQLTGPLSLPESSSPTKPLDTLAPSKDSSVLERWLRTRSKKTNKNQSLQPPDGLSTTPSRPAKPRSRSKSPPRVNTANKRPSWFIPGQRVRRAVAKPVDWRKGNSKVAKPDHAKNDASRSGQRPTSAKEVDSAQKANDAAQPSAVAEVHVMPGTGDATVSIAFKFKLPAWVLCLRSSTDDGNH